MSENLILCEHECWYYLLSFLSWFQFLCLYFVFIVQLLFGFFSLNEIWVKNNKNYLYRKHIWEKLNPENILNFEIHLPWYHDHLEKIAAIGTIWCGNCYWLLSIAKLMPLNLYRMLWMFYWMVLNLYQMHWILYRMPLT